MISASLPDRAGETIGDEKRLFSAKIRGPVLQAHRDTADVHGTDPNKKQNNR
jgi:hypothetical protein